MKLSERTFGNKDGVLTFKADTIRKIQLLFTSCSDKKYVILLTLFRAKLGMSIKLTLSKNP